MHPNAGILNHTLHPLPGLRLIAAVVLPAGEARRIGLIGLILLLTAPTSHRPANARPGLSSLPRSRGRGGRAP
ncbi:hypothetical protein [Ancylobacter lacus]|uniref:hypothetical protein n=1 Tax=Ancylobacter lacus TaxID=2579970 RepID=UPI001BD01F4C|nr:hypothetical protein [Ancylobacter lacus]MBS7539600.1 hypothetical protein [Ancylobacter lacus]